MAHSPLRSAGLAVPKPRQAPWRYRALCGGCRRSPSTVRAGRHRGRDEPATWGPSSRSRSSGRVDRPCTRSVSLHAPRPRCHHGDRCCHKRRRLIHRPRLRGRHPCQRRKRGGFQRPGGSRCRTPPGHAPSQDRARSSHRVDGLTVSVGAVSGIRWWDLLPARGRSDGGSRRARSRVRPPGGGADAACDAHPRAAAATGWMIRAFRPCACSAQPVLDLQGSQSPS